MSDTISFARLLTLGQMADRLGVPQHRAKYALTQYGIRPTGRVGILRVWSEDDLPRLERALAEIASHRGGRA